MKRGTRISILGAGRVGSAVAHSLAVTGLASEIILLDEAADKARGEALDIRQGASVLDHPVTVSAGSYEDTAESDIVIFTLGAPRQPGQSRMGLAAQNVDIVESVIPRVARQSPNAIYIVVSNPVDIITYTISRVSGLPENQVIGTGCLLDTARLVSEIAPRIKAGPKSIRLLVLGEHGSTAMIPWSLCTVYGEKFDSYFEARPELRIPTHDELLASVRSAGGQVVRLKGATFYAAAAVTAHICSCVVRDTKEILPVSTMLHGEYGLENVCLSLPCVVGANGIERVIAPKMTMDERDQLVCSGESLIKVTAGLLI